MKKDEIIEVMARAIVEGKGESADSVVSRFAGSWSPIGPLWKVEGIPIAEAILADLTAKGLVIVPVELTPERLQAGTKIALSHTVTNWPDYMGILYRAMIAGEK